MLETSGVIAKRLTSPCRRRPSAAPDAVVAVMVYFSHFDTSVPLLAPILSVIGLIVMGRGLKTVRVGTWTTIRKGDGTAARLSRIAIATGGACGLRRSVR